MTKYEYDYETLTLTEEQQQMVQIGIGNIEFLNDLIKDAVNERAADGWEPLWPFMVPHLWFRKSVTTRRKKSENN